MLQPFSSARGPSLTLLLLIGVGFVGCVPPEKDNSGTGGKGGSGEARTGGSGGSNTGGSPGSGGTGGVAPTPAPGGTGGQASPIGGSAGGAGGRGGSGNPGSGGSGGSKADAGGPTEGGAGDGGGAALPTFTKVYTEILVPGCTGPNGACHSSVRDNYFHFAEGMQARSYMLLVNTTPRVGVIPPRVKTLIDHVVPKSPNAAVEMPPQSGPLLGNPPLRKPPLTPAQVAVIKAWAEGGAKND